MQEPDKQNTFEEAEALLGAEASGTIEFLVGINDYLDTLDSENRELYDQTLEQYATLEAGITERLKSADTPRDQKPKYIAMRKALAERKATFRARFPDFVAEEERKMAEEKLKAKAALIFEKLEETPQIAEEEKKAFLRYWHELPVDEQNRYLDHLKGTIGKKDEAGVITGFRGILFELSRRAMLLRQGLEETGESADPIYVEYLGYDKADPQLDKHPTKLYIPNIKNPAGDIQIDIKGVVRNGKPFVYETKAYPRRQFGAEYGAGEAVTQRNQLLKYQKAISDGQIAGASVEIQGRIDPSFLNWAIGEGLTDEGTIPDVELIYSLPLPSGREFRFVLKRGRGEGLKFENEKSDYTVDDKIIIRGLAQSVRDKSISRLIMDVAIAPDTEHPLVTAENIAHPENITNPEVFEAYNKLRLQSIWDRLEDKAIDPPVIDKVSAYDERANREYVMQMLVDFENMLNENPAMKAMKGAYVVEPSQYDEVVDKVMEEVGKIRDYENARRISRGEKRMQVVRNLKGYKGPKEGFPLDVEHILMDALQNVTKTGEDQKPRSYSDTSRFIDLKSLKGHLEEQDRAYLEIVVYDPQTGRQNSKIVTGRGAAEGQQKTIEEHERNLVLENLKRAETRLAMILKRYEELHKLGKENRDDELEEEYRKLQSSLSGYNSGLNNRLKKQKTEIAELEKTKKDEIAPLESAMKDIRAYLASAGITLDDKAARQQVIQGLRDVSEKYAGSIIGKKQEMAETYRQMFAKDWDTFTLREISRQAANLMKMIYVVTPEENVVVEEERIRGAADSGRAAHSELAQGRNIYAAGELAFQKIDGEWVLTEINIGSGHYRPTQEVLEYGRTVICEQLGINPGDSRLKVRNSIFRGLDIDGLPLDYS